jgi:plastocyanin
VTRVATIIVAVAAAAALAAGCGSGSDSAPPSHGASPTRVEIRDFVFRPGQLRVAAGTRITWTNRDSSPHTATGQGFDTGTLRRGESKTVVLSQPGTYAYYCQLHPFMKATVVVREG